MKHEFFQAVYAGTIPREDGQRYRNMVSFSLIEYQHHVHLERIRALEEKRNYGSLCMAWLTTLCDQHSVTLQTIPAQSFIHWRQQDGQTPQQKLEKWYTGFDFAPIGNYTWRRMPRTATSPTEPESAQLSLAMPE